MRTTLCVESASVPVKKRVMIEELVKGHEAASQLKLLLDDKPYHNEHSLSSHQLMANVLTSFTQSLSIITSSSSHHYFPHRNLLSSGQNGPPVPRSGIDLTVGDSTENRKRFQKGRRSGRYNRRRSAWARSMVSCTTDDNHAWRKYGQKQILNSQFPRSYFRCSYKYDQGCQATKQVQRDQENPDMYQTTYIGIHTCNATSNNATHSTTGSTTWESYFVNSDRDSTTPNVQDHHQISSPNLTIEQKFSIEKASSDVTYHKLDPSLWSDLKDFEPYVQAYHYHLKDGI